MDDAENAAELIATNTPAWVISVGYSLAPEYPFAAALEDGFKATAWAIANARARLGDGRRLAVAAHHSGGNIAACLAAMARDRATLPFQRRRSWLLYWIQA
ncbi:alpha/beta hydrolase fold domain-containing protein [Paraburkholderia caribensis]|uniref:alpha/beta hydrolase fold domain-containing protein n=1 Tax=Paraburkholderia caribensis TaxID=75105 RepID=UPI0034D1EFC1